MVEIRNYANSDFPQVKQILEEGELYWDLTDNAGALERKVRQDPDSILVAVEDGRVVGTQFVVSDYMPILFRLAVRPDYRRKGIGKALMEKGEAILRERGFNHVNILVAADDEELQDSYERRGYERGDSYLWMVKEF